MKYLLFLKTHKIEFLLFLTYCLITALVFWHKMPHLFTHYGMSDVDTDGTIWYFWARIFSDSNNFNFQNNNFLFAYPLGYDFTYIPFFSIFYEVLIGVVKLFGLSWSNLVFFTNLSLLIAYPLTAISTYLLAFYLTKSVKASFLAGLIFAFSFYFILMGRGSLAQNHLEIIPLYFLSLFYFINNKKFVNALLSAIVFSILFLGNAYWAFFSAIFSVIILIICCEGTNLKLILKYYTTLVFVTVSVNLGFFINQIYVLNPSLLLKSGKIFDPRAQVVNVLSYFAPSVNSFIYKTIGYGDNFLGYVSVAIGTSGIVFLRKNRLFLGFALCFLTSILLSAYIPGLFFINEVYFKLFGAFRSVSRLNLFSSLFLAIMAALAVSGFEKHTNVLNKSVVKKTLYNLGFVVVSILIVFEGLNTDPTWYKVSNFSKNAELYQEIKNNNSIKVIAGYPMNLSGGTSGFPPNYERLSQVIHNKTLVGGASPFNQRSLDFYDNVKDISDPKTIDYLSLENVDTVIVYTKLLAESERVIEQLRNDGRLTYVGFFEADGDHSIYTSFNEMARSFYVFQISEVVGRNLSIEKHEYSKITPFKYEINVSDLEKKSELVINEPYSPGWNVYVGDTGYISDFIYLFKKPLDMKHEEFNHTNKWSFDSGALNDIVLKEKKLTVYYTPDIYNRIKVIYSWFVFSVCILYILFYYLRFKRIK